MVTTRRSAVTTCAIAFLGAGLTAATPPTVPGDELRGEVARVRPTHRLTIEAAFPRDSYRPGAAARLVIFSRHARNVWLQIFRAGTEPGMLRRRDVMGGTAVTKPRRLAHVRRNQMIRVRVPDEDSGLYFVKLVSGRRVGYAPFVLAPPRLGVNRVAVVLPTFTWQAYNFRDDDEDGDSDTWYADQTRIKTARLGRPFENRGVPPHYKYYDQAFLQIGRAHV